MCDELLAETRNNQVIRKIANIINNFLLFKCIGFYILCYFFLGVLLNNSSIIQLQWNPLATEIEDECSKLHYSMDVTFTLYSTIRWVPIHISHCNLYWTFQISHEALAFINFQIVDRVLALCDWVALPVRTRIHSTSLAIGNSSKSITSLVVNYDKTPTHKHKHTTTSLLLISCTSFKMCESLKVNVFSLDHWTDTMKLKNITS